MSTAMPEDVWSFLEQVAVRSLEQDPEPGAALIRAPGFDYGRMVDQAMRHSLLPAVAAFVHRHGLRRALPVRLRIPVMAQLQLARHRARLLTRAALDLDGALKAAAVPMVWTKGVVLQSSLYDDDGTRTFNDLDMMVLPIDRDTARNAIVGEGFVSDHTFDPVTGHLRPISRVASRMYQLSPDHLPHFHRLTDDLAVPVVVVDVANSLTWHGSPWEVPVESVHGSAVRTEVHGMGSLSAMSPAHALLFVCLHLFREGWFERTILTKDLSLAQFADIAVAWHRLDGPGRRELADLVVTHGLQEPVSWATAHTDSLWNLSITADLGLHEAATPEWLTSARSGTGARLRWHGSMRDRLRSTTDLVLEER